MAMNGTITTWFKDKGFGFIKDENGENRYFHVIKVANPDLIKKDAAVTFEPTTNNKGLSAYAVKVIPESKYIYIAGERLKLTSIKSYVVYREEEPVETRVDKENAVLSVGLLMNSIRPKSTVQPGEMRSVKKLAITTFQGTTLIFSEDEIDIDATVKLLKVCRPGVRSAARPDTCRADFRRHRPSPDGARRQTADKDAAAMPVNFDFNDLYAFRALMEYGSFRLAAESICLSQSALSRRIEKLETALGNRLFERTTRRVTLTLYGQNFAERSEQLLAHVETVLADISQVSKARTGLVR